MARAPAKPAAPRGSSRIAALTLAFVSAVATQSSAQEGASSNRWGWLSLDIRQDAEGWLLAAGEGAVDAAYTGLALLDVRAQFARHSYVVAQGGWLQGQDLSSVAVGDAGVVSNIAGRQALRVIQLYGLWETANASLKVGLLALDDDFMLLDAAQVFVNSGFGTPQTFALNFTAPIYPLGGWGLRLEVRPVPNWELRVGAYDYDSGSESQHPYLSDVELSPRDGILFLSEVGWRLGSRHWAVGVALSAAENASSDGRPSSAPHHAYLMGEEEILPGVIVLGHAAVAPPLSRATATTYVDAGVVVSGALWGREKDRAALGATWTTFGERYRRGLEQNASAVSGSAALSSHEGVVEWTYTAELLPWMWVQPTVQWIDDAHFNGRDALTCGLRLSVQP